MNKTLTSMSLQQISDKIPSRKILIVTSCTKDKLLPPNLPNRRQILADQLWDEQNDDRTKRDFGELENYRIPAGQLYKGLQHLELMRGVELLRQAFGANSIDVKIISAGFGVVDEKQLLPPYEATFADQPASKIITISQRLGIPHKINEFMSSSYDCAFFLLGENYILSLGLPFASEPLFPCFFLASADSRKRVPQRKNYQLIPTGKDDSSAFSYNLVGLKGHLFKLFAKQIIDPITQTPPMILRRDISAYERLESFFAIPTPEQFLKIINPFRQSKAIPPTKSAEQAMQLPLFTSLQSSNKRARNYGRPMHYFIPDWDDLVDPGYNFETDTATLDRKKYDDEVYAHEIYKNANYDGLLFSKSTIEKGVAKRNLIKKIGIHAFSRFNASIMGDCGAFSYITSENPPYRTEEILDYYQMLGFDYGVSIDHLIVPAFYPVKEHRYKLTRENAYAFLKLHRTGNYTFTPIGVAQGWSPETYKKAVIELLEWGYQYIALGGLARTPTKAIYGILEAVAPVLQADTDLHLFGIARDREGDEMQRFRELGVTSFDSASYLRRAWMSDTTNYVTEDSKQYTALRISPVSASSSRVKKIIAKGVATFEQLQKLEQEALKAVRAYDRGMLDIETTLDVLLEIGNIEGYDYDEYREVYRRTLEDQPWKKCSCEICRDLGIEVIIFRSNDRNRRRGFHNTYVFYQRFRKLMERGT
jgi:hypothetical protein